MAPEAKKRQLPPKVAAMKARKRARTEGSETTNTKVEAAPTKPAPGQPVRLDNLGWKEVEMPDRLDDFEGFFGLDEIDDVEVIRDASGKISYQAAEQAKAPEKAKAPENANKKRKVAEITDEKPGISGSGPEDIEDLDGEWSGFSEDDKPISISKPQDDKANGDKSAKAGQATKLEKKDKKEKANKTKKGNANESTAGAQVGTMPFAGIDTEVGDDELDMSAWNKLDLSDDTMIALSKLKFPRPTLIQSAAIPEVLAGHDVIGKAQTGSGKTLAYGIPIVEAFLESRNQRSKKPNAKAGKSPIALILSPTRELAHQISEHITSLCSNWISDAPSVATLTGGLSLQKQQRILNYADIVVGTPGRLWEVISEGHGTVKQFKGIRFLVVDEADRLLSEGHFKEVEDILNILDREDDNDHEENEDDSDGSDEEVEETQMKRQTLVFSATFHKGLQQKLAGKGKAAGHLLSNKESMDYLLKKLKFREEKPKFIDVNPVQQMAQGLKEGLIECTGTEKDLYLYTLLLIHAKTRTLVFTNSVSAVRRLHPFLTNLNLPAVALHSHMEQKARLRSVERFSSQPGSILIATDVAARGLDIRGVQVVIHYHLPRTADMYVHRSGRTARAESSGSSILICSPEEVGGVRRLVAKVHAHSQSKVGKGSYFMRSLDIDRRIVTRVKPRATLAKKLADTQVAQSKSNAGENNLLRQAAEDLGVDYDSEELEQGSGRTGRGNGRKKKEREAKSLSKDEIAGMRAELKALLAERVNVGVSERYLTSGGVDIDALIREKESGRGEFLGRVGGLGLED